MFLNSSERRKYFRLFSFFYFSLLHYSTKYGIIRAKEQQPIAVQGKKQMSENTTKKATKENKTAVKRDKNGKFASKKPECKADDGTVKINKVPGSESQKDKDTTNKGYGVFFSCKVSPEAFECPKFPEIPGFPKLPKLETHEWSLLEGFEKWISEEYPDTLKFKDKKYYSEKIVDKMISDTILKCADVAIKEEEAKAAAEEAKREAKKAQRDARIHAIAKKLSKFGANIICAGILFGLGCAAALGVVGFWKLLWK